MMWNNGSLRGLIARVSYHSLYGAEFVWDPVLLSANWI